MGSTIETGALVAVILAAFKIIEALITKVGGGSEDSRKIQRLYEMHLKTDDDGTPIWYVPRSFSQIQKDIMDKMQIISENQIKTTMVLERLLKDRK